MKDTIGSKREARLKVKDEVIDMSHGTREIGWIEVRRRVMMGKRASKNVIEVHTPPSFQLTLYNQAGGPCSMPSDSCYLSCNGRLYCCLLLMVCGICTSPGTYQESF